MIIFGWNHFLIVQYIANEVGLADPNAQPEFDVEIRQKYVHIFWIPIFPIGKIWAIRKYTDEDMYHLTEEAKQIVERHVGKVRTPWYAYSGLILISIFFLYIRFFG